MTLFTAEDKSYLQEAARCQTQVQVAEADRNNDGIIEEVTYYTIFLARLIHEDKTQPYYKVIYMHTTYLFI